MAEIVPSILIIYKVAASFTHWPMLLYGLSLSPRLRRHLIRHIALTPQRIPGTLKAFAAVLCWHRAQIAFYHAQSG